MANPLPIVITAGAWQKIATAVFTGQVHRVSTKPTLYLQMYKLTGDAAPTLESEGAVLFQKFPSEEIESPEAIDVYIWAKDRDGKVRVDL